ncbi:NADP-dependent oxidoreductase [Streptomyces sp. NPDC058674]|uniref:NADP-dependent oxidoreductase n=1 Tax=Streptomyces sp. NPDC058674 TaxID=3346592 RepID=UPI0036616FED
MPKAIRFSEYGDPEVLRVEEVPLPEPGEGQVRVKVAAAGVNGLDWKVRRGLLSGGAPLSAPMGTGLELSGVVDAVGPGAHRWRTGQAVFGGSADRGAAAEYDLAVASELVAKPDWLGFEEAAALPVATETAYRTLRLLDVRKGQTLLIHAAAGGVGLLAGQIARARGATVIGTAATRNHAFLREVGISPVLYGEGLVDRVRAMAPQGIDAVLDASGRGELADSVELTGSADGVVTIADPGGAAEHGVRFTGEAGSLAEAVTEVLPLVEAGRVRMPIDSVFPLDAAADAQRRSESGHLQGKVVIRPGA